jgi:hypothetical protein
MAYLLISVLLVCFALPWIWVSQAKLSSRMLTVDWIDGMCLGFGISFLLLYLCSLRSLSMFHGVWVTGLLVGLGLLITSLRRHTGVRMHWGSEARILLLLCLLYIVMRSLPLFGREYPLGWDSYFHLVLADKILRVGRAISDWRPFENIELNYPIGSHLLLALIADIAKVQVHKVFNLAIIIFTALTGMQVFAVVSRAVRSLEIGLYAGASYLFLAALGSLAYSLWGGLPNLIGMYLFFGLLSLLHREDLPDWRMAISFAILFLSISLVHHHAMLTAAWVLAWQLIYFRWIHPDPAQTRRLTMGLTCSAILGSPYFLDYLLKVWKFGETGIGEFVETLSRPYFGDGFLFAMLFGILIYFSYKSVQKVSRSLLQAISSLLVIFVLFQYLSRVLSLAVLGKTIAPFTPSRFLTDCVGLLSVFPALFLFHLKTWCGRSTSWAVGLILAGFLFNWPFYRDTFRREIPESNVRAYHWIRENAADNAIIIDPSIHASYLTQRMSSNMPIPTSEFLKLATNRRMTEKISRSEIPPEALERQILVVTRGSPPLPDGRVLWSDPSGLHIVEVQTP